MAAWIVLGIGLFLLISGVSAGLKLWRMARWPTVQGRVVSRKVERSDRVLPTRAPAFRFEAKVTYLYEVNGTKFEGHEIRYATLPVGTKEWAQAKLDALPDLVTVHYNPENPAEAYLFVDPWVLPVVVVAFGLVAALGAALYLIGSSRAP